MTRGRWRSQPVSAGDGKLAAGGDDKAPIDVGVPPAELPAIIEAVTSPLEDLTDARRLELDRDLERVRARLGVSAGALGQFLRDIGEAAVPPEQQPECLAEIAARHQDLLAWIGRTASGDPRARELEEARAAIEAGEYHWAEQLLNEAKTAAVGDARRPRAAAEAAAENGELAMSRMRYRQAATYFAEAADLLPGNSDEVLAVYLDRQGVAAWRGGDDGAAARAHRAALATRERVRAPDDRCPTSGLDARPVGLGAISRYAEAEPLHRRAVAVGEETLPADHPNRSWLREDSAAFLDALGRGGEAARLPGSGASGRPALAASLPPSEAFDSRLGKGSPGGTARPKRAGAGRAAKGLASGPGQLPAGRAVSAGLRGDGGDACHGSLGASSAASPPHSPSSRRSSSRWAKPASPRRPGTSGRRRSTCLASRSRRSRAVCGEPFWPCCCSPADPGWT